jgi:trigger factor
VGGQGVMVDFSNQLLGLKRDEEKSFTLKLPEQFHVAEHRGKEAQFQIKVKEIKEKKFPELDADFLKTIGDFPTVEDLKKAIRTDLEENQKKEADSKLEQEMVEELVDKCKFDLPVSLVENRIEILAGQEIKKFAQLGLAAPDIENKKKELKESLKKDAEKQLRAAFLLQEIARKENLQVSREDLEEQFKKLAHMYQQEVDRIKDVFRKNEAELDRLISELLTSKTIGFLKEKSEIKDKMVAKESKK